VKVTVYQYPKCSTCRKALAWLVANGVEHATIDLVETPPSRAELERAAKKAGVPVKKMFNVSGESYRAGNFKDKLATMSDAAAFAALAADGKLIKRPLLVGDSLALVGFDENAWRAALL
jgi:arsenate reductase